MRDTSSLLTANTIYAAGAESDIHAARGDIEEYRCPAGMHRRPPAEAGRRARGAEIVAVARTTRQFIRAARVVLYLLRRRCRRDEKRPAASVNAPPASRNKPPRRQPDDTTYKARRASLPTLLIKIS